MVSSYIVMLWFGIDNLWLHAFRHVCHSIIIVAKKMLLWLMTGGWYWSLVFVKVLVSFPLWVNKLLYGLRYWIILGISYCSNESHPKGGKRGNGGHISVHIIKVIHFGSKNKNKNKPCHWKHSSCAVEKRRNGWRGLQNIIKSNLKSLLMMNWNPGSVRNRSESFCSLLM